MCGEIFGNRFYLFLGILAENQPFQLNVLVPLCLSLKLRSSLEWLLNAIEWIIIINRSSVRAPIHRKKSSIEQCDFLKYLVAISHTLLARAEKNKNDNRQTLKQFLMPSVSFFKNVLKTQTRHNECVA